MLENVPALWAASAAGHFAIVQALVFRGLLMYFIKETAKIVRGPTGFAGEFAGEFPSTLGPYIFITNKGNPN